MNDLPVPQLLIDIVQTDETGLPLKSDPSFHQELELCRKYGFNLTIADGRVFLPFNDDQLVSPWIESETPAISWDKLRVQGFFRLTSTNNVAIERAREGAPCGTLIYAEEQTSGKGRKGRSWLSPAAGAGLYFTFVLRPEQPRRWWPLLTHVASLALAKALRNLSDRKILQRPLDIDLKWPNDVLLSGKKCAGILLETLPDGNAVVVGVGVNVHEGSIPESLQAEAVCIDKTAGSLVLRRRLLTDFLHQFQLCYRGFEQAKFNELLDDWKCYSSMWNETPVWITDNNGRYPAITCGLSETGALLVRTSDGQEKKVLAADVSIRRVRDGNNRG
jgi:BirA family biotin operon repressor/biotin-[acetyl-CoA-carboxylase] ligase